MAKKWLDLLFKLYIKTIFIFLNTFWTPIFFVVFSAYFSFFFSFSYIFANVVMHSILSFSPRVRTWHDASIIHIKYSSNSTKDSHDYYLTWNLCQNVFACSNLWEQEQEQDDIVMTVVQRRKCRPIIEIKRDGKLY